MVLRRPDQSRLQFSAMTELGKSHDSHPLMLCLSQLVMVLQEIENGQGLFGEEVDIFRW
eukprot:CAMPEP_0184299634 /NCGR_PEP_ID=MMETSP1049-20130417/10204_1 /TAXON_ID=77928 /ORGANISM="Proteomonas sulcata, Strain CCMP704" /LENGTH=58 /DNA_ID=CAMNT_0026610123 /DNA_START=191 /DNA_END=364 /DNA_ORIENTATION=+